MQTIFADVEQGNSGKTKAPKETKNDAKIGGSLFLVSSSAMTEVKKEVKKEEPKYSPGLAGVYAGKTAISTVGKEGIGLTYRGYGIVELADQCCFEEVAYLLLYGRLPNEKELKDYIKKLGDLRGLNHRKEKMLKLIRPSAHPMDVLRTICSFLGTYKAEGDLNSAVDVFDQLIASMGPMLLFWHHYCKSGISINTKGKEGDTVAMNFVRLLHYNNKSEPDPLQVQTIDKSLILYAEHGFAASTFVARTVASTLSDAYSCVVAAIGALRGPLHGGANEAAFDLINQFTTAQEAEEGVMAMLKAKKKIMGFGHRVYKTKDPRNDIIK
eukprot:g784.t1